MWAAPEDHAAAAAPAAAAPAAAAPAAVVVVKRHRRVAGAVRGAPGRQAVRQAVRPAEEEECGAHENRCYFIKYSQPYWLSNQTGSPYTVNTDS